MDSISQTLDEGSKKQLKHSLSRMTDFTFHIHFFLNLLQPKLVSGVRGRPGQRALSRVKVEFNLGQGRAVA